MEMIKIAASVINNESVNTVNARELHAYLGVGKDFSTWIKDRIQSYDFEEGVDYTCVNNLSSPNLGNSKSRAQLLKEYKKPIKICKFCGR